MKIIPKIANSPGVKKTVSKLAMNKEITLTTIENGIKITKQEQIPNLKRLKTHLSAVFAAWFGILYNFCIYNEKGIPKERKNTLVINSTITTTLGIVIGYALDKMIDKPMNRWGDKFEKILDETYGKNSEKKVVILKGFRSMIPMLAFVFACRFIAPVIATPMADKVSKYLVKQKLIKNPEK